MICQSPQHNWSPPFWSKSNGCLVTMCRQCHRVTKPKEAKSTSEVRKPEHPRKLELFSSGPSSRSWN